MGEQAGMENALPMVRGLKATIAVEREAPRRSTPTCLATCFQPCRLWGRRGMSVVCTGATGPGANTEPLWSMLAMTFSPGWG
jgi:hypothetical protein